MGTFGKISKVHPSGKATSTFRGTFRTAIIIRIILGYNLLSNDTPRILYYVVNTYCFSIAIVMLVFFCYLMRMTYTPSANILNSLVLIEYVITILTSCVRVLFINFEDVVVDVTSAVTERTYAKLLLICNVLSVFVVVNRIAISMTCYMLQSYCLDSPLIIVLLSFALVAIELNQTPRVVFFSLVYYRMKMLRKKIKAHLDAQDFLASINNVGDPTIKPLLSYLKMYAGILDHADYVARRINPLFMLSLVCCFPKIMCHLYEILALTRADIPVVYLVILSLDVVLWLIMPCLPGVVAELVAAEVDHIKQSLLHHRLRETLSERYRSDLGEFLSYVEARPFRYRIWRMIPVDLTLPVGLLSLCTTYFIVVIQFSHLYG